MTRNNLFGLVVGDLEIERTTLRNLRVKIEQKAEELELEFKVY